MSEWISVKDRLPEINEMVLGFAEFGLNDFKSVQECKMVNKKDSYFVAPNFTSVHHISHWMPLTPPPKEPA